MINVRALFVFVLCMALFQGVCEGKDRNRSRNSKSLDAYLADLQKTSPNPAQTPNTGSVFTDGGSLANIAADYKARSVGDVIVISIVEQTLAQSTGTVASQRTFDTKSNVTGLAGRVNTGGVNPLVAANSDSQLKGQAQTASATSLKTSIAGQVVAVLPSGGLVVEAHRDVLMNNERQTVVVRGVARPGDIAMNNVLLSSQLSNLEVELMGKGIISDATRQPNLIVRWLLRVLSF